MAEFSVILIEPKYSGNIGSAARAMKNFGFEQLLLVNPVEIDGEARARAVHARDILENSKIYPKFSDILNLGQFDFLVGTTAVIATDKNPLRTPVFPEDLAAACELKGRVGLVFGREDIGMLNEEIQSCDLLLTIPASYEYPTLNLSHSVAVVLYELSKIKNQSGLRNMKKLRQANKIEKDVLFEKFDEFIDCLELYEYSASLAKRTLRVVLGRSFISGREAFTLMGPFRRAKNKIEKLKEYEKNED